MNPFAYSAALNPDAGNGDGFASWNLGEEAWLGMIADAPSSAKSGSADVLKGTIDRYLEQRGRETIGALSCAGGGAVVLADLLSSGHETMREEESDIWAAATLVLVSASNVYLACVGDCAVYVLFHGEYAERVGLLRYSDTTKYHHCLVLPQEIPQGQGSVAHHAVGQYLGAGERRFSPSDIVSLDRSVVSRLLLVTDGFEEQVGVSTISSSLRGGDDALPFERTSFVEAASGGVLKDDATFVGLELPQLQASPQDTSDSGVSTESVPHPEPGLGEGLLISDTESGVKSSPKRSSIGRRFFGFLISFVGLALLAMMAWKIVVLYLEESNPDPEPAPVSEEQAPATEKTREDSGEE